MVSSSAALSLATYAPTGQGDWLAGFSPRRPHYRLPFCDFVTFKTSSRLLPNGIYEKEASGELEILFLSHLLVASYGTKGPGA